MASFFGLCGVMWISLAWIRYGFACSLAQTAQITLWAALTDAAAVSRCESVEAGISSLQKLTEAMMSLFIGLMFFATAFIHVIPMTRRRVENPLAPIATQAK